MKWRMQYGGRHTTHGDDYVLVAARSDGRWYASAKVRVGNESIEWSPFDYYFDTLADAKAAAEAWCTRLRQQLPAGGGK
jgi:hypothetical protein